ncbi:MAG: dihydrofolate reductase family protein [Verrucomicrobiota bacterium]
MRVTLIAVQSLDGFITRHDEPGAGFASAADQAHFRAALQKFDCGIVGRATYDQMRASGKYTPSPGRRRVVLTRTPEKFAGQAVPGALEFSAASPAEIVARLRAEGCRACALLGGSQVHSYFFAAGMVDELWLTIEARVFGGGTPFLAARADVRLSLLAHEPLGDEVLLLRYGVVR